MALKSAYREKPAAKIPAEPHIPDIKIDGQPPESMEGISAELPEEATATASIDAATEADSAALALKHQIEAIRRGEAQRQHQAAMMAYAQRPPTRAEKLAHWRANCTDENELKFLAENPELIDMPELTAFAANEAAQQGHERGTEEHMNATKELFDKYLAHLKAQAEAAQTPQFFRPTPQTPPEPPRPASYTSAPVSRGVVGGGYQPSSPSQVKLTADEIAIARASGISPVEYAKHRLELERQKRMGERQ